MARWRVVATLGGLTVTGCLAGLPSAPPVSGEQPTVSAFHTAYWGIGTQIPAIFTAPGTMGWTYQWGGDPVPVTGWPLIASPPMPDPIHPPPHSGLLDTSKLPDPPSQPPPLPFYGGLGYGVLGYGGLGFPPGLAPMMQIVEHGVHEARKAVLKADLAAIKQQKAAEKKLAAPTGTATAGL